MQADEDQGDEQDQRRDNATPVVWMAVRPTVLVKAPGQKHPSDQPKTVQHPHPTSPRDESRTAAYQ